jgi:hypothetical protein
MTHLITKPGRYGDLHRYEIVYSDDDDDPGCPEMVWHCWAYELVDAVEKFQISIDGASTPRRIARMTAASRADWTWHKL